MIDTQYLVTVDLSGNNQSISIASTSVSVTEIAATTFLTGPTGAQGSAGAAGANGQGVPIGGTTGQILSKVNGTDYNTQWVAPSAGSGDMTKVVYDSGNVNEQLAGLTASQTLTNKTVTSPKINSILDTNGNPILDYLPTASAVNYLQLKNNTATFTPGIAAVGTDTNINIDTTPKGTGRLRQGGVIVPTISSGDTLTNKVISGSANTISNIAESSITNLVTDLAAKATDTAVVHNTGAETVAGTKTFSSPLKLSPQSSTYVANTLVADSGTDSLTYFNSDANVALQVGQEEWIRVVNNTGSTIANGSAVYINGASGGNPTVALAQANAAGTTIGAGLTTEAIANGATGFVTCIGNVNGLNTIAFTAGQTVYISATTPGALTATAPLAPNYRYRVGIVGTSSATVGTIHVTPSTASLGNGSANQIFGVNAAGTAQEVKTIQGTSGDITVTHGTNSITIDTSTNVATLTGAQVLTNKTIAGGSNTVTGLGVAALGGITGTPTSANFLRGDGTWSTPAGSGDMVLASAQTNTGAKTFNSGTLITAGSTSGTTTLNASAVAGTTTNTLPARTAILAPLLNPVTTSEYFGLTAGNASATATNNVAIGYQALDAVTSGGSNIAIGANALGAETVGGFSVAIGENALAAHNSSGSQANTAIGRNALVNATGGENMAFGAGALSGLIGGNNNTAIGNNAGAILTTGGSNIALGMGATFSANNISNAMVVGSDAAAITASYIGRGMTSTTAQAVTLQNSNRTGTDVAAGDFTLRPGQGTGTSTPTSLKVDTPTVTTTGTTAQAYATRVTINSTSLATTVPITVSGVAVPTISSVDTLTNKTIAGSTNSVSANTLTIPNKFLARRTTNQTITNAAWNKVQTTTEDFDTGSNFDNVTNFRFVAPVAGFYQFSGQVAYNSAANGQLLIIALYKNGVEYLRGNQVYGNPVETHLTVSPPIFQLAATDYIELWTYNGGGSPTLTGSTTSMYFGGNLVSVS